MEVISKLTTDNWITIAAIVVPIFLAWLSNVHLWLWSLIKKFILDRKIQVISPSFDHRFSSLNKQVRVCPFLDKNGHLSIESLIDNHRALLQGTMGKAGELRTNDVFIKCYKMNDGEGGTTLVSKKESITNLMPSEEVHLTLSDIIKDWNKKVSKVKNYGIKDKVEFVSRFHLYFEMIHPFLDGNGRIGRSLIEEQLSYLFSQIISFDPEIKQYHRSIELGIKGDESELRKLILEQIKKHA
ncbi:MAG: Fic family protein [Proteobacteria bacterium]|nr:Fic family protein [Pseudomonadota bacterium]MBU4296456.1 Fic family protein [Pseudomonadota bacterium]MCG2748725.1 Fic family protein [Desulfobulbaceae bacterium]